jgi:hypothetical protein
MADEPKKPSRAERMYGKGAKIRAAEDVKAAPKPESKTAEAAEPRSKQTPQEEAAEGDGGGGIPISDVHVRESKAMHTRHQQEYSALVRRHAKERESEIPSAASTGTAGATDTSEAA